jgi:arginine/lysine/ornithine decarboxylase
MPSLDQSQTPYADALDAYAQRDVLRLNVPGHNARRDAAERLVDYFGEAVVDRDLPPLLPGVDNGEGNPLSRALDLAADAWGAHETWFLTNGASQANRLAALALAQFGGPNSSVIAQRSAHSSFIDGLILSGLSPHWVLPTVDAEHGINHGITVDDFRRAVAENPDACGAYIISPSYFGAVADIEGIAAVAHDAGMPLIVDGAWGAHFGFHPDVPENPLALGADVLVSSTHKLGGSLTQSAMIHVGKGPFAERLTDMLNRVFPLTQSTSYSSLLLASLDIARSTLATGHAAIERSIASAESLRAAVREHPRLGVVSDGFGQFSDIVEHDPLHVSIDVSGLGRTGLEVINLLMTEFHIELEIATDTCVVAIVGPGHEIDSARLIAALTELAKDSGSSETREPQSLPPVGGAIMQPREAFFAPSEIVDAADAVGRISADTVSAYPPGIPNLMPGEVISAEVLEFLAYTAQQPGGYVRGALTPAVDTFRVVR